MKFDICLPNAMEGLLVPAPFAGANEIAEFACMAEQLGYHGLWAFDFINPVVRPEISKHHPPDWYELMTTLAYLCGITKKIRLVAGVVLLPLREPVLLAKQVATIDRFSGGRLDLGIGLGNRDEFNSIHPTRKGVRRGDIQDEMLEALILLLNQSDEPVSYVGDHVRFENVSLHPKVLQDPLPMYTAAESPAPLTRAAKWGLRPVIRAWQLEERKKQILTLLAEDGRSIDDANIVVWADISIETTTQRAVDRYLNCQMGRFRQQDGEQLRKQHWIGTVDEVARKLIRLKRAGIEHVVAMHTATDTYSEMVDQAAVFAEEVMPLVESA